MTSFLVNSALNPTPMPALDEAALEGLLLRIGSRRAQSLQDSVRNEAAENRASNVRVSQFNEALQALEAAQPENDEGGSTLRVNLSQQIINILRSIPLNGGPSNTFPPALRPGPFRNALDTFINTNASPQEVRNTGNFAQLREVIRTEIDQASSDSQLNLIRLQGIINRSNQATEFVTNVVQRFSGVEDRINPNFR